MSTELDLMVARLMGWDEVGPGAWTGDGVHWLIGCEGIKPTFAPSLNMEHASLILDHIAALGWAVTVFTGGWHDIKLVRCCIMRSSGGPTVDVQAETRPLAICRAFIQAMERWGNGID